MAFLGGRLLVHPVFHLSFPLSLSFAFALRSFVRTCVRARANMCELLAAVNYELRLITMCAENRKFSGRDSGGGERSGEVSPVSAPDFGTPANYSKRMGLLLTGCSAIHAYNKPGLSAVSSVDRGGFRLTRVLISFWARRSCRLIIGIPDKDSNRNRHRSN